MQHRLRDRGFIIGLLSLGVLAGVALMAHPAQAVDAIGPYYAEPAWDQKFPALTRFVVLTDWSSEAVLDKETGLVWERSPVVTLTTWSAARIDCSAKTIGNRKGWRLPSVHELTSLLHPAHSTPALPPGHPFIDIDAFGGFWSATTDAGNPAGAWGVDFDDAVVDRFNKAGTVRVWCVRGGMQAEAY